MDYNSLLNVEDDEITKIMQSYAENDQFLMWKPELRCPGCHRKLSLPGPNSRSYFVPHLLKCGHSLCYACVNSGVQRDKLECPQCTLSFSVPRNYTAMIRDLIPMNYYLQGVLQKQSLDAQRYQDFLRQQRPNVNKKNENLCNECFKVSTKLVCQNCCLMFCKPCFNKLHLSTVSFANHKLQEIEKLDENVIEMIKKNCSLHSGDKTFYCENCNLLVCSMCMSNGKHKSHKVEPMDEGFEENRHTMKDLIESLKNARTITEEMIKKLESADEAHEKFAEETKTKIHEHFNYLHGKLQIEEETLMKKLSDVKAKASGKTGEIKTVFDNILFDVQKKMQELASFSPSSGSYWQVTLSVIISECKKLLMRVPEEVLFEFEESPFVFTAIDDHQPSKLSLNDNFGRFEITKYLTPPQSRSMTRRSSAESITPCVSYRLPRLPNNIMSRHLTPLRSAKSSPSTYAQTFSSEDTIVTVKVVNYISLSEMYVIPIENYRVWKKTTLDLKMIGHKQKAATNIEINALYLVKYNNEWHRGRVLSTEQKTKIQCQLVDIGGTVQLRTTDVMQLPEKYLENYDLLMKCGIIGVGPLGNVVDIELFIDFVLLNQESMMYIYKEKNDTKFVDFIPKHEPCSVRDTLVKFGCAESLEYNFSKTFESIHKQIEKQVESLRKDSQQYTKEPPRDDVFNAKIIHAESPYEIYLIESIASTETDDLESQMQTHYNNERFSIIVPWVGRCLAVYHENTFRRGKVLKDLNDGNFEVHLVDYGLKIISKYDGMKRLQNPFYLQRIAFCCSLKDVRPLNDELVWSKRSCEFLRRLLSYTVGKYEVVAHSKKEDSNKFEATINRYVGGIGGNLIHCVNTQLVTNNFAISCGPQSQTQTIHEKTDNVTTMEMPSAGKEKRHKRYGEFCYVAHVKSPSEFYVGLDKYKLPLEKLQQSIQELMENDDGQLKRGLDAVMNLLEGGCLVQTTIKYNRVWCRGIMSHLNNFEYAIYLRDFGQTVVVPQNDIAEIPQYIAAFDNSVYKCSLAGIKPVAGLQQWTQTGIELFKTMVHKFKRLCVKFPDDLESNEPLPVQLHGLNVVIDDPLAPEKHHWTSLSDSMVQNGVASRLKLIRAEPIGSSDDENQAQLKSVAQIFSEIEANQLQAKVSDRNLSSLHIEMEPKQIEAWIPARPNTKTLFCCTPTWVDTSMTIYIQDNEKLRDINYMKAVINKKVQEIGEKNFKKLPENVENLPCLAKFHIDGLYHRGRIVKRDDENGLYVVEYVDYGNVETNVMESGICLDVIAYNVPLFVQKVQLYGIAPKDALWNIKACDLVHFLTVDKICNISIEETINNVNYCRLVIYSTNTNVADFLLDKDFAVRSAAPLPPKIEYEPITFDFNEVCFAEKTFSGNESFDSDHLSPIIEELVNCDGLDISRMEHLSIGSFDPQETSSRLDPFEKPKPTIVPPREPIRTFPPFDRTHLPDKFFAIVLQITGPRTLEIQPNIGSNRNFRVLMRALDAIPLKERLKAIEAKAPCLAMCEARNCPGRALVSEVNHEAKTAEIFFIDYLKSATMPFEELYECPAALQQISVLWVSAEINHLKKNKFLRSRDLVKKMSDELNERYLFCVVKNINTADHNEPIDIEIYENESCENLAYAKLIENKYYARRFTDEDD